MAVIGGNQGHSQLFAKPHQLWIDAVLNLQTLILDFNIKSVSPKNIQVITSRLPSRRVQVVGQVGTYLATQTGRKTNQSLLMFG